MKLYRFFYHYNKMTKRLTVHFKGQCIPVDDIKCYAITNSKWSNRQPYLVMQGFASKVEVDNIGGKKVARIVRGV